MASRLTGTMFGVCIIWLLALSVRADMVEVWWKVDNAMRNQEWATGESILEGVFSAHRGQTAPEAYGPLSFKKGWCEMKQGKFEEAARSFERCYQKFPDRRTNRYHLEALRCWADAAFAMEEWELALRLYNRYRQELAAVHGRRW